MERIALNDITLNTQVSGAGDDWIILSNSLGCRLEMWTHQLQMLHGLGYRVLAYDQRGHGRSDAPGGQYSFAQLEGDVIALMDHFGIARASYMGLSMGAMTGIGLALGHADRFDRMVLADGRADMTSDYRAMFLDRIVTAEADGMEALLDEILGAWFAPDWQGRAPLDRAAVAQMILDTPAAGYAGCCWAIQALDYFKDLGRITTPCLYVGGENDGSAAPAVMRPMAEATPGARYVEIPRSGHLACLDEPEAYNAAIQGFLAR